MHSSQAASQPQAPAAPSAAPQLTFGSTPAPTPGPGTGVVTLLLPMQCIAAAAAAAAAVTAAVIAYCCFWAGGMVDPHCYSFAL